MNFILPFAGFCDRNFGGNVVAESEITTKNPNVQEKSIFYLLIHRKISNFALPIENIKHFNYLNL